MQAPYSLPGSWSTASSAREVTGEQRAGGKPNLSPTNPKKEPEA